MPERTTATRRRLAAQALRATADRLAAASPLAIASVPGSDLEVTPMVASDLRAQLLALLNASTPATLVSAPVAPVAAKLTAAEKWAQHAEDKVIVRVNALGRGLNQHKMFVKRAEAIDPQGLYAAFEAGQAPAKAAAKPAAAPAPVAATLPGGITLAQFERFMAALGGGTVPAALAPEPAAAPTRGTLDGLVRRDGTWYRCLLCEEAYWGVHRDADYVLAKALKHVTKAHAA